MLQLSYSTSTTDTVMNAHNYFQHGFTNYEIYALLSANIRFKGFYTTAGFGTERTKQRLFNKYLQLINQFF